MAILISASEWLLPHWIPLFWHALGEYRRYTGTVSVIGLLVGGSLSRVLEFVTFAAFLGICWRERRLAAASVAFTFMLSLVLAITILVVPTYGPYNQVFLIPALLVLVRDRRVIWQSGVANRILLVFTACLVLWPWISGTTLAALSFLLPQTTVERGWALPIWTLSHIPVAVAALMLIHYYQRYYRNAFTDPPRPGTS
jgi:hypothetical protein